MNQHYLMNKSRSFLVALAVEEPSRKASASFNHW